MTYYVQIPCIVTRDRPNRTATPDRWVIIPVQADSQAQAVERVEKALVSMCTPSKEERDIDIDDGC